MREFEAGWEWGLNGTDFGRKVGTVTRSAPQKLINTVYAFLLLSFAPSRGIRLVGGAQRHRVPPSSSIR